MGSLSMIYQNPAQIFGGECLFGGMEKLIPVMSISSLTFALVVLHQKIWETYGSLKSTQLLEKITLLLSGHIVNLATDVHLFKTLPEFSKKLINSV